MSARVMTSRKKSLSNLGNLPKDEKNGAAVKKQAEWPMEIEVTLKRIVKLA